MRDRKGWMNKATDPVLELLDEQLMLNARAAFLTLQFRADDHQDAPGRTTVYDAINELEENGYIEPREGYESYYSLTQKGRDYLNG